MKVKDLHTRIDYTTKQELTYGYCSCGREVTKGYYTRCPLCMKYLEWGDEDDCKGTAFNHDIK